MRFFLFLFSCPLLFPLLAASETLRYSVNWPTGLPLGEASFTADNLDANSAAERKFEFHLEASIPTFSVVDDLSARVSPDYCAIALTKRIQHGKRKGEETLSFDRAASTMERKTKNGGSSRVAIENCAKDALGFVYFLRQELRQGRIPPPGKVYFGAAYQIAIAHQGTTKLNVKGTPSDVDRFQVTIVGPASRNQIEIYVARDTARTPVLFRVPLILGAFTMEIVE